jgi:D-glycero-D-manno-heptose 1,7-bisphosphate phosphatase
MEASLEDVVISGYYLCYAAPEDPYGAPERKPSPAMLLQAAEEHGLDLKSSIMIGDRLSDVQCGKNAGCTAILTLGHSGDDDLVAARLLADYVAQDLKAAAEWVLQKFPRNTV